MTSQADANWPRLRGSRVDVERATRIRTEKMALLDAVATRIEKASATGHPEVRPSSPALVGRFRTVFLEQTDADQWIAASSWSLNQIFGYWITAVEVDELISEFGVYSIPAYFER